MSSDPVILACLGKVAQDELQLFERVYMKHAKRECVCFVCIGRHHLFFVSRDFQRLIEGERLEYLLIEKAVEIDDGTLAGTLMLQLSDKRPASWEGDKIVVSSHHRQMLLERIGLCWQAEYMYKKRKVMKFPKAQMTLAGAAKGQVLSVLPFKDYEDCFQHRGYKFMLRKGFKDTTRFKTGAFLHEDGWEVPRDMQPLVIPAGVKATVHVHDAQPIMELERRNLDDIRTVATNYKQALTEHLDQFYVLVNSSYMKRMNRTNDIASWDGWEIFIRSREYALACILLRREYIPPLCDTTQDIAIMLRCPADGINHQTCEALLDECRFIADTVSPVSSTQDVYRDIIQARLDALQLNEEAYTWMEGHLGLVPCHKDPAALKFVKSIANIYQEDQRLPDEGLLDQFGFETPTLHKPILVPQEMVSDASGLMSLREGPEETEKRRNAWLARVARYLAYAVDGNLVGDRFTLSMLVQGVGKGSYDAEKTTKGVIEFLLHARDRGDWTRSFSGARLPLAQLLQDPDEFSNCAFNERVMRTLLQENYIRNEWMKRSSQADVGYQKLLAELLTGEHIGIGLRALICRQILEQTGPAGNTTEIETQQVLVLVPALVRVLNNTNPHLILSTCATAALVNLSCGKENTKNLLLSEGSMNICIRQMKAKDEDLTLYTLYLLVNLTKAPHHRAIVVSKGAVPVLVDILTSSYQNLRMQRILTEVSSIMGQLCNDSETRNILSEEYHVVDCLLWVYDAAQPNTKLKSKLLFALRQLSVSQPNKVKVGQHVIPTVLADLALSNPKFEECATNSILLLTMLASIKVNCIMMNEGGFKDSLEKCGLMDANGNEAEHKFSRNLWDKVLLLKDRMMMADAMGED